MTFDIPSQFAARVRIDEPLSRHTSWHVGGPADIFFMPRDRADLIAFLKILPPDVPLLWLGLGSNLLVRDGGVRGVVVSTRDALTALERRGDRDVYAEAGLPCAKLARQCARWDLGPAEFFSGIPGTVGGALAMNAGAFGGETWPQVRSVETVDRHGTVQQRDAAQFAVSYRHVDAPANDEWFLSATFHFDAGSSEAATRALLERRKQTQPIGEWSCGSVFTNPAGDHAARLIEAAGLKGLRIGGAVVSTKHANFILNEGAATARDIEMLIQNVQRQVAERQGCTLTPECRIVGEAA
jgi:UDP-N-acetylmuramate dehydrogenase